MIKQFNRIKLDIINDLKNLDFIVYKYFKILKASSFLCDNEINTLSSTLITFFKILYIDWLLKLKLPARSSKVWIFLLLKEKH